LSPVKKKRNITGNEEVNELTWKWFVIIPLSGPLIQEKARTFTKERGNPEIEVSNERLESSKNQHAVLCNSVNGEANGVELLNEKTKLQV